MSPTRESWRAAADSIFSIALFSCSHAVRAMRMHSLGKYAKVIDPSSNIISSGTHTTAGAAGMGDVVAAAVLLLLPPFCGSSLGTWAGSHHVYDTTAATTTAATTTAMSGQ